MDLFNQLALITEEWLSIPLKIQALLAKGKFDLVMGNYGSYESILELIKSLAKELETENTPTPKLKSTRGKIK